MFFSVGDLLPSLTTTAGIYIFNTLLIITVIFAERKSPSATLAWLMVLAFLPVVGFVFYAVFNQNLTRSKINRLTDGEEFVFDFVLKEQMKSMREQRYLFTLSVGKKWNQLINLNQRYGNAYYSENNKIQLIVDGKDLMQNLFYDIKAAKDSVNIEYFIIKKDEVGLNFIELLTEKAKQGVSVRLLIDAMGSRRIHRKDLKYYLKAGGKVGFFFRPKFKIFALRLNYRNHRKIVVIDGKIGYTGGYNIGREYIGNKKKFGYWRDTHIRIEGDAVVDLHRRFILDWRFTTKEDLDVIENSFISSDFQGNAGIQIVSCGPESPAEEVKRGMMRMITSAQKNVYLQTPYFVPDASIIESLKMAAQSGVDVKVMIPCRPDHVFVYWATYAYVGELLRSGAKAYIYEKGFLHAKTLVVDGEVATVGSTNFDNRSFRLNFETNAFIFDQDFSREMELAFEKDLEQGRELTYEDYLNRGVVIKFKEAISRLVADIL